LASVSIRTLHYYGEIGLLSPSKVGANGYRYYDDNSLLRLQQILFYREIGLELLQIKDMLDSADFDLLAALRSHRTALGEKMTRLHHLITTVDDTILHLIGEKKMSKRQLFQAFSDEKQKDYEREARLQWGPDTVNKSIKLYNSYSDAQKKAIGEEGNQVYSDIIDALEAGKDPNSPEVQDIFQRWHQHLRYFYEPTFDVLRGLGEMYNTHPEFIATFVKLHPDLPPYLQEGIRQYVDDLETAELERMLEEDRGRRLQG
jgi:DNA-binding transcriptional MerR regulator